MRTEPFLVTPPAGGAPDDGDEAAVAAIAVSDRPAPPSGEAPDDGPPLLHRLADLVARFRA